MRRDDFTIAGSSRAVCSYDVTPRLCVVPATVSAETVRYAVACPSCGGRLWVLTPYLSDIGDPDGAVDIVRFGALTRWPAPTAVRPTPNCTPWPGNRASPARRGEASLRGVLISTACPGVKRAQVAPLLPDAPASRSRPTTVLGSARRSAAARKGAPDLAPLTNAVSGASPSDNPS